MRVSPTHKCQSLLLGLSNLDEDFTEKNLEELLSSVDSDMKEITNNAAESDLVIIGLQRLARRRKKFGKLTLQIARETSCPLIMISRSG